MISIESAFLFAPDSGTALARFLSRIEIFGPCWVWTGCKCYKGYGRIHVDRKLRMAHRMSFLWANGYLTEGLTIDHLCRNTSCVNPAHLEEVTNKENILRGEGVTARFARQTHCKRGHPLDDVNTYRSPSQPTIRSCRICQRLHLKKYKCKCRAAKRTVDKKAT